MFTQVVVCINNYFLFITELYSMAWMYHVCWTIYPLKDIWAISSLGAIMNRAAMDICVQVPEQKQGFISLG